MTTEERSILCGAMNEEPGRYTPPTPSKERGFGFAGPLKRASISEFTSLLSRFGMKSTGMRHPEKLESA